MTTRTRYFVIASLLVLTVGLGTGLLAYYVGFPTSAFSQQGGPDELQFVPADASLVAYADVQRHHDLGPPPESSAPLLPTKEDGQQEFQNQTGINIETDIDRVVASVAPSRRGRRQPARVGDGPGARPVRRGEDRGADARARRRRSRNTRASGWSSAAATTASRRCRWPSSSRGWSRSAAPLLVHQAVDLTTAAPASSPTTQMMNLVRDLDSGNAWAAGRFDVLAAQAPIPAGVRDRLPPVTWFSATARVDGGLSAVVRAETSDEESANSLRDVVRGGMALAKLQAGSPARIPGLIQSFSLAAPARPFHSRSSCRLR